MSSNQKDPKFGCWSRVKEQDTDITEEIKKIYQQIAETESNLSHLKKQHQRIKKVNEEEQKQIEGGKMLLVKYEHQNKELDQLIDAVKTSAQTIDGHLTQSADSSKTVNVKRSQFKVNMTCIIQSLLSKIYL